MTSGSNLPPRSTWLGFTLDFVRCLVEYMPLKCFLTQPRLCPTDGLFLLIQFLANQRYCLRISGLQPGVIFHPLCFVFTGTGVSSEAVD